MNSMKIVKINIEKCMRINKFHNSTSGNEKSHKIYVNQTERNKIKSQLHTVERRK